MTNTPSKAAQRSTRPLEEIPQEALNKMDSYLSTLSEDLKEQGISTSSCVITHRKSGVWLESSSGRLIAFWDKEKNSFTPTAQFDPTLKEASKIRAAALEAAK